jgi:class 3 adenylate cyclase
MSWSHERSRERITKLMGTVPAYRIDVKTFDGGFLRDAHARMEMAGMRPGSAGAPIFSVSPNEAVVTDAVHVYVQLIDYGDAVQGGDRETEAGHRRLLQFLHLHYSASDSVVDEFGAQRVDYHGPRLHAVVPTPAGDAMERQRIVRALALASTLKAVIEEADARFGRPGLRTRVRIGIDTGKAVAINSGRGSEPEPLFLGNPANYAAKLAEGDEPGIFLSDRVRAVLGKGMLGSLYHERAAALSAHDQMSYIQEIRGAPAGLSDAGLPRRMVEIAFARMSANDSLRATLASEAVFDFHHHTPPLRTIAFKELMPSRSIRMPLVSIFADIDGFTAYVDRSIRMGQVREMVANLHVIRGELANVLKADFDGRKVRFIGDCVHGLLAEGTRYETDASTSVTTAVRCAGGLRSSFELCQSMLPGIGELGLAIGLEFGTTPITRLGLRGERSVRCASSKAVSASEDLQSRCEGHQTAIGDRAFAVASARVRQLFRNGIADGLDFDVAEQFIGEPLATPAVVATQPAAPAFRAHST